jgi:predicted N-acetyltransferase YhbS
MGSPALIIRASREADREAIVALHMAAFGEAEGEEVSALANDLLDDPTAMPLLSLVAEQNGQIIGHVHFSAVRVLGDEEGVPGRILAPLAVAPTAQGRGIGSELTLDGLERLRAESVRLVFVLGHPGYYPKFGFQPAGALGLDAPYPIEEKNADAWMVQELHPGFLGRVKGTVQCAATLMAPEHWQE